jgi:hypothetical protein
MTDFLSKDYWNNRYEADEIGWDLKIISPPLKAYIDQLTDKNIRILIPGCGSGYEAEYLLKQVSIDNAFILFPGSLTTRSVIITYFASLKSTKLIFFKFSL